MSTAVFGGSFNPVHLGHVRLAREVMSEINAERLIVMPTYISPFKQGADNVAEGAHRLEMCRLAFSGFPDVIVSDYEINSEGVSYTVNTLRQLHSQMPQEQLYLIVGSDSLESLPRWHRFEEIMSLCTVAAAARSREDTLKIDEFAEKASGYGKVIPVKIAPLEISSTEVRRRLAQHRDVSGMLPESVIKYITENHLYAIAEKE